MIYFIKYGEDRVKIGYTSRTAEKRLKELNAEAPNIKKEILKQMPGNLREEKTLHDKFRKLCIGNEYFRLDKEILDYIYYNADVAKKIVRSSVILYLRKLAADAGGDEYVRSGFFGWRVNRGGPCYGVWEEYPWIDQDVVTDEIAYGQYLDEDDYPVSAINDSELWAYLIHTEKNVIATSDVAIQHKGWIVTTVDFFNNATEVAEKRLKYKKVGTEQQNTYGIYTKLFYEDLIKNKEITDKMLSEHIFCI